MSTYLVDVEANDVASISFCGPAGNRNYLFPMYK